MSEHIHRLKRAASSALPTVLLFGALASVSLATAVARYEPRDLCLLLAVYLLLAAALTWQAAFVVRVLPRLWWLSASPAALAIAWHLRESAYWPHEWPEFAGCSAVACVALSRLVRRSSASVPLLRALGYATGSTAALLAVLLPAFHALNDFRWHVLEHNRLLAVPLYYASVRPAPQVIDDLWAAPRTAPPIAPVPFSEGPRLGPSPNILFVLVDTLRADRLAPYGGSAELMPHANALAARSTLFTDVNANAPWTRPSIASMFTGLLQEQHGAVDRDDALRPSVTTLAEHLSAIGYETVALVTNYGAVGFAAGYAQGFDEFIELTWDGAKLGSKFGFMPADEVNRRVAQWLAQRPASSKPLFLYVHYLDPHEPWVLEPLASRRHSDTSKAYDAHVRYFDQHFDELLTGVGAALGSQPVIVFTADHGEEFGEHGASGHGSALSPEQLHIPLLVAQPQGSAQRVDARLEGRDIFSLVGYLANGGRDLVQWGTAHARESRYASVFLTTTMSVLQPRLKHVGLRAYDDGRTMLQWSAFGETFELYDLAKDPDRRLNRFEEERHRAAALTPLLARPMQSGIESKLLAEQDEDARQALRTLGYVD